MSELKQLQDKLALYEAEQKALEARLEELSDFMENAAVPLHWVNADGNIIWANKAELNALGYTGDEYIGASIRSFHADANVIEEILQRLSNYETLIDFPARLICKDGTIKHVLISSSVWRKDGEFKHTRCFTRDVTHLVEEEVRKTELLLQLAESEARFRLATESTNLGTWDWQPHTGNLYWSYECRQLFGISMDAPISFEIFLSLIYPDDRENVRSKVMQLLDNGVEDTLNIRYRIIKHDTLELRWIKVQCRLDIDKNGAIHRLVGTALDITETKYGEDRSAMLSSIIDSSDDAIVSKTLEGIITSWNDSAERTFGYNAEEMIGQPIFKLIPEDRKDEEVLILSRLRRGERVEHFETKRQTKSGELLDVSLTISPVKDAQGNIIGLSKIARDITAKKQEQQRKNDFVAIVSHELKTPLTSITIYNQMLSEWAESNRDEFSLNALKRMEIQIKKMTSMIRDFLSLARIEESKLPLHKEVFDLHELVAEIAEDPQFSTLKHTIHVAGSQPVKLFADRDKMTQVMVNLLGNAIKYSPNGGNITCGYEVLEYQVRIFVRDEGVGIEFMDQKRLFERFYRVSGNNKGKVSGFGIGLYLVSEILRYHQSQIHVKSEMCHGAEFYFTMNIYDGD